jgi:hypothetical protein
MNWTISSRTLIQHAGKLAAALVLYAFLRQVGFYNFTAHEAEGLGVLIQLVGDIYAVLLAFMIFVIWGQFTDVENCVIRECDSVDDLLRFSAYLNADDAATLRRAVTAYTRQVLNVEWLTLGDGQKDDQAEKLFLRVVNSVIEAAPKKEAEQAMRLRLIDMAQRTSQCRDERVAKSLTRIPPTLAGLVNLIAGVLLSLIFVYPFHHWAVGVSCFILVAVVLFLANFVLMDTDNPLKGTFNVSPEPFARFH